VSAAIVHRTAHPFFMYDAIRAQPEAFARVAARSAAGAGECAERIASCARVFIIGIGTSHHAAQVGAHLFRTYGAGLPVEAVHSFDFALYGPPLTPRDCVILMSHRGTKRYSLAALARARAAHCFTVLISGEGDAREPVPSDATFLTVAQEKSAAHTISYTSAIAVLAVLAGRVGERRAQASPFAPALLTEDLPAALRAALGTEQAAAEFARHHSERRRIWLLGGGPSAVTAQEIALKIRETSYLQAEGMPIEAILHGPFLAAEPQDLFILIAPAGAAQQRVIETAGAVREVGAPALVVSDGTPEALRFEAAGWWTAPAVPEPFTTLTCLVPLQLLTYHLALTRGTNPDRFRRDDPRFDRAFARLQL
jgi:glutamine---fructose-6-phosphate transaminase (isomerizing)